MNNLYFQNRDFTKELRFYASRSSGAGGQHVNKVNSKVELRLSIQNSALLSATEKKIIVDKLKNRINREGELIIISQEERSQQANKEIALSRFYSFLKKALKPRKKRIQTKPSASSNQKRLEAKKKHSEKKAGRLKYSDEND